ncbi:MAG TPA: hypothetical protein VIL66_07250 [Bacillota bacterium]
MLSSVHYTLRTTSLTNTLVNAVVTYDVYYDAARGLAYQVELQTPLNGADNQFETAWQARIVYDLKHKRLEYDLLQRIYYQTRQTIRVERAMYNLQEDLLSFLSSSRLYPAEEFTREGRNYPGFTLYTLTIWFDPVHNLPVRRENRDRGNLIIDDFTYHEINTPLPAEVFQLPKPEEAVADFDLFPTAPTLPRFEKIPDAQNPQYGVYVQTLLAELKRHIILNQWQFGPFATISLPWLTELPVSIYRSRSAGVTPPLIAVVQVPGGRRTYFFVAYDFLGYVVTGFQEGEYDLNGYDHLPIQASLLLEEFVPLFAAPSTEKEFVVFNIANSVRSNDFFINAFDLGGKSTDLVINNFSFHENEGYLILNVYGKEYWDNANLEAMFNFVTTGRMADAHTVPITIYTLNTIKRMGIYRYIQLPVFQEIPGPELTEV